MEEISINTLIGTVISDSRHKTITVVVERVVEHEKYGKRVKRFTKCHAHDENNQYKKGDKVIIKSTNPISKTKFWVVESLVKIH